MIKYETIHIVDKGSLQKKTQKVEIFQLRSDPPPISGKVEHFFLSFLRLDHISSDV